MRRMHRMRFAEILREAGRNIASGTTHASLWALFASVIFGVGVSLELLSINAIIGAGQDFHKSGASIMILTREGGIDGRACDALVKQPGVLAAGAIQTRASPLTFLSLPQNPAPVFLISPGFAGILPASTGIRGPGVVISEELADTLGATTGTRLPTGEGPTEVSGTYQYPDDGRPAGMGYAALVPTTENTLFDACWIDNYPVAEETTDLLYTAIHADAAATEQGPQISQHNTKMGVPSDLVAQYQARPTATMPLIAAGVLAIGAFIAIWVRRLELAAALHSGARKADQLATALLETVTWLLPGVAVGTACIAIIATSLPVSDYLTVVLTATQTLFLGCSGALLGASVAIISIRERSLFFYFKNR